MRIVISYAREDRPVVEEVVTTLSAFGHDAWTDAGAHSGARWWDEILQRIRDGDLVLAITSPDSLNSRACTLERQYAVQVRRHLLPVMVRPVGMQGLPSDLAQVHFFDYTQRDPASTARLYRTLLQFPPAPPLPHPLPPSPPPPLSYLNEISDRIAHLPPDVDEQHRIVTALTNGLRSVDSEERATALGLLQRYLNHPHRLPDPADRAGRALPAAHATPSSSSGQGAVPRPVAPPLPPPKRSRVVTVLAWVGGVTIALIALLLWSPQGDDPAGAGAGTGTDGATSGFHTPAEVSQSVQADLVSMGYQPGTVSCGSLQAVVGATTYCSAPGLPNGSTTVTARSVQDGRVMGWTYS